MKRRLTHSRLGDLFGTDRYSGRVVWLEHTADGFVSHVILDDVRRVADVRVGDLDGDDDMAVAIFGYSMPPLRRHVYSWDVA